jgi:hypothetical protein
VLAILAVGFTLGPPRPLFAMPPVRGEVMVVVAGDDHAFKVIAKSLTESLAFVGVTPRFERVAAMDPPF